MNHATSRLSRADRRMVVSNERRNRNNGDWGRWETLTFPAGSILKHGWTSEFTTVHRNRVFSVLDRTLTNGVRHLAISSLTGVRPTWPEAQRIKDDLAGESETAVEVYPPKAEIIDQADMYHLWVLPEPLPFSLFDRSVG